MFDLTEGLGQRRVSRGFEFRSIDVPYYQSSTSVLKRNVPCRRCLLTPKRVVVTRADDVSSARIPVRRARALSVLPFPAVTALALLGLAESLHRVRIKIYRRTDVLAKGSGQILYRNRAEFARVPDAACSVRSAQVCQMQNVNGVLT